MKSNHFMMSDYDADSITVLKDLEPVRKRPAMYIGDTDIDGLHHLLWEVIDNSVDEAMAGHCDQIEVVIYDDGRASVADNGRGIPIDEHPEFPGKSALEIVLTILHAGGKFDDASYKTPGGLHGVGVSCTNALSEELEAHVWRDGHHYQVGYERGLPASPFKQDDTGGWILSLGDSGTKVIFKPDHDIFTALDFKESLIIDRIEVMTFLNPGLTIWFKYKEKDLQTFYHAGGLAEYIKKISGSRTPLHDPIKITKELDDVMVDAIIQYSDADSEIVLSFVNNIPTADGGTHISGFRSALTRTINSYSEEKDLNKEGGLTGDDIREGITAILSMRVPNPQFVGQTKGRLGNQFVRKITDSIFSEKLGEWLDENPKEAKIIIEKAVRARQARMAAKRAREAVRKKVSLGGLQGILTPCESKDPEDSELFIVEGSSAGGSAKSGRDNRTQAILPLRGKPLNVEKVDVEKMMGNREIRTIISALGCGIETVGEFDYSALRYHRILLMADADVDGAHIVVLLRTFFFRHLPKLIEDGHIFVACPPLYKIQKGRTIVYVQTEEEKERILNNTAHLPGNLTIQRYKGLGEMDAKQLWETTMDPDERTTLQLTIENYEETQRAFVRLMGNDPRARRDFIYARALDAEVDV